MNKPVTVRSAPGLTWRKRKHGYEARWQARTDLVAKGFPIKSQHLWTGAGDPTKEEWDRIADRCNELQAEMIVFGRGGLPEAAPFDGTLRGLMRAFRTDPDSRYHGVRYHSRRYYDRLMSLIDREHGGQVLSEIKIRAFVTWHKAWIAEGKTSIAHAKMGMLRTVFSFGATLLEDDDCARFSGALGKMRFPMEKARIERLTAAQAAAVRAQAHAAGKPSIALAQAFQFEVMLRQKDVIGEWVPLAEPGISDTAHDGQKWLRGIRWEEIDQNMILRHMTSKRQKFVEVNLRNAPMVLEELARLGEQPASGPIVVSETTGRPWTEGEFRRHWRKVATAAGIPKTVRNMDSRAGAISEATDAGADLEHVRHAATHSNISMTQRYSRGSDGKVENVQKLRAEHRKTHKERDD